jgi:hypothetical protein
MSMDPQVCRNWIVYILYYIVFPRWSLKIAPFHFVPQILKNFQQKSYDLELLYVVV